MRRRWLLTAIVAVALLSVASTGCVSKKMFRKNVESNDTRVAAVETGVEANEKRIKDLSDETDSRIAALASETGRGDRSGDAPWKPVPFVPGIRPSRRIRS